MKKVKLTRGQIQGIFAIANTPAFVQHEDTLFAYALNVNLETLRPEVVLIEKAKPSVEMLQPYIDKFVKVKNVKAAQIATDALGEFLAEDAEGKAIFDKFMISSEAYDKFMNIEAEEYTLMKVPVSNFPSKLNGEVLKFIGWMIEMPVNTNMQAI
ncbi:MAG: hypothetical protein KAH32_04885 [Chlamydiia bacterium]|nr:hypothetical protein [Chlamydiia bacterium]